MKSGPGLEARNCLTLIRSSLSSSHDDDPLSDEAVGDDDPLSDEGVGDDDPLSGEGVGDDAGVDTGLMTLPASLICDMLPNQDL